MVTWIDIQQAGDGGGASCARCSGLRRVPSGSIEVLALACVAAHEQRDHERHRPTIPTTPTLHTNGDLTAHPHPYRPSTHTDAPHAPSRPLTHTAAPGRTGTEHHPRRTSATT